MEGRHPNRTGDVWFFTHKTDDGEFEAVVNCCNIRSRRKGETEKEALKGAFNDILKSYPGESLWLDYWTELVK